MTCRAGRDLYILNFGPLDLHSLVSNGWTCQGTPKRTSGVRALCMDSGNFSPSQVVLCSFALSVTYLSTYGIHPSVIQQGKNTAFVTCVLILWQSPEKDRCRGQSRGCMSEGGGGTCRPRLCMLLGLSCSLPRTNIFPVEAASEQCSTKTPPNPFLRTKSRTAASGRVNEHLH